MTHPRLDTHAGVPAGTTSYYFRTRKSLLQAVAARITELDLADLTMMDELNDDHGVGYSGTLGLARLVMLSGTAPYMTRTRARFELILHAHEDPDLNATMAAYGIRFYALARDAVSHWYGDPAPAPALIEERAIMVLTFISGVMTSFVNGHPVVVTAEQLNSQIRHILHNDVP